jgi:hypothetical protein
VVVGLRHPQSRFDCFDVGFLRLLKNPWPSFRGAPKARTRNPEHRDFLHFWIPGPPP